MTEAGPTEESVRPRRRSRSHKRAAMPEVLENEDCFVELYRAMYYPDCLLLPVLPLEAFEQPSLMLARGIPANIERIGNLIPSVKTLYDEARKMTSRASAPRTVGPRTVACACTPNTTCEATGQSPIIGWVYTHESRQLCAAAYEALDGPDKAGFKRVAPTVWPAVSATDVDDGALALTLPGTRRALAALMQQVWVASHQGDHCFGDDEEDTVSRLIESDELLCEYTELCVALKANEFIEQVERAYEILLETETEAGTDVLARMFFSLSKIYPSAILAPASRRSSWTTMTVNVCDLLIRSILEDHDNAADEADKAEDMATSGEDEAKQAEQGAAASEMEDTRMTDKGEAKKHVSLRERLQGMPHFANLELAQLATLISRLPPDRLEEWPILRASLRLDEVRPLLAVSRPRMPL